MNLFIRLVIVVALVFTPIMAFAGKNTQESGNIILFTADWCKACKELKRLYILPPGVRIVDLTTVQPDEAALLKKYAIKSIPAILITKNGKVIKKIVGLDHSELQKVLKRR